MFIFNNIMKKGWFKMEIINKKIDFDKSLDYYLKDKNEYRKLECHLNAYDCFYKSNEKIINIRESNFYYVTGVIICESNGKKYAIVHSWVEENKKIIDVTFFANSLIHQEVSPTSEIISELRDISEEIIYIPNFRIANRKLTNDFKTLAKRVSYNPDLTTALLEKYLNDIVIKVANDIEFKERVKELYDCEFEEGNTIDLQI